ncbi:hypothetical protein Mapa_011172 [Marchantia paleacea]|nr:hypothetical protein Mapa_011172 [Marchantia paleacea]
MDGSSSLFNQINYSSSSREDIQEDMFQPYSNIMTKMFSLHIPFSSVEDVKKDNVVRKSTRQYLKGRRKKKIFPPRASCVLRCDFHYHIVQPSSSRPASQLLSA